MVSWQSIVDWLPFKSSVNSLSAKLDPEGEALRHRLRAEMAAMKRMTIIAQRTALMGDIIKGPRGHEGH